LFDKLMALDRKAIRRSIEASSNPPDPSRPWWARQPTVRQRVMLGLGWIVVGAGLVAWVAFGGGPPPVLGGAIPWLGMGLTYLIMAVVLRPRRKSSLSGRVPRSCGVPASGS
jgi:peptidoglycan/LPS O-acetylase OafA/YrhL